MDEWHGAPVLTWSGITSSSAASDAGGDVGAAATCKQSRVNKHQHTVCAHVLRTKCARQKEYALCTSVSSPDLPIGRRRTRADERRLLFLLGQIASQRNEVTIDVCLDKFSGLRNDPQFFCGSCLRHHLASCQILLPPSVLPQNALAT